MWKSHGRLVISTPSPHLGILVVKACKSRRWNSLKSVTSARDSLLASIDMGEFSILYLAHGLLHNGGLISWNLFLGQRIKEMAFGRNKLFHLVGRSRAPRKHLRYGR